MLENRKMIKWDHEIMKEQFQINLEVHIKCYRNKINRYFSSFSWDN